MLTSVHGVYRKGKIELVEKPADIPEDAPVIVTFLEGRTIDLAQRGIKAEEAAEIRARLATFAEDWDSPEMAVYDDYDANTKP